MNRDKVSKCCGAELYDQAENNYGGGYAPNEVCSHCEKPAESIEDNIKSWTLDEALQFNIWYNELLEITKEGK
mgnify:CR=1 FL=1